MMFFHASSVLICIIFQWSMIGVVYGGVGRPRYSAPDECRWSGHNEDDLTLVCRLRTINSELEKTNFSVIQPQSTTRLRVECNDSLFFQSSISPNSFGPLIDLKSLSINYCKIGNLSSGSFNGLTKLQNLTIQTHNGDWSSMSLEVAADVFTGKHKKRECTRH